MNVPNSLISLFVNNSRTAQITFFLTVSIVSVLYYKKHIFRFRSLLKIFISMCILFFISFQVLKDTNTLNRYISAYHETKEILAKNKYEGSFGARVYFNIVGFDIFKEEPILGSGPEDNIDKLVLYQKNDLNDTFPKIYNSFHSQHIDLLTRYGLVGYLLVLISAIYLIYSLRHFREMYYTSLSFFLIVFFSSLANVMLIKKPFNYVYITIFVLFSVISYQKNKSKNERFLFKSLSSISSPCNSLLLKPYDVSTFERISLGLLKVGLSSIVVSTKVNREDVTGICFKSAILIIKSFSSLYSLAFLLWFLRMCFIQFFASLTAS